MTADRGRVRRCSSRPGGGMIIGWHYNKCRPGHHGIADYPELCGPTVLAPEAAAPAGAGPGRPEQRLRHRPDGNRDRDSDHDRVGLARPSPSQRRQPRRLTG